jgi:hypothetical protein
MPNLKKPIANATDTLFLELSTIIEKSKKQAISQAQSTVTTLFWEIG